MKSSFSLGKLLFAAFLIGCALYAVAVRFNATPVLDAVDSAAYTVTGR